MKVKLWLPLSRSRESSFAQTKASSLSTVYLPSTYFAPVLEFIPQFIEPSQNKSYTKEGHLHQA